MRSDDDDGYDLDEIVSQFRKTEIQVDTGKDGIDILLDVFFTSIVMVFLIGVAYVVAMCVFGTFFSAYFLIDFFMNKV